MKKITTLLMLWLVTFSQAQLFSSVRTNGGADQHTASRVVTDWLHYDNGSNYTSFGASSGSHTLGAYIKLTQNILAPHINRQIEEVKFFIGPDAVNITGNITVEIYTNPAAAPAYTEDFAMSGLTAGDWNTVTLTTPFVIDGSELYVGYKFTAAGYIIGVDDGSSYVPNVNFYTYDGGAMTSWDGVAAYNFNLQAGVGGATATNDAGVANVVYQPIMLTGTPFDVTATITNYGSATLNSIDFNYQVDGGAVYTDQLTGLNLASGQSTTVTHSTPWNPTVGAHNFDVFVSNFNGNGSDDIPANDHQIFTISVASNTTQHLPLYEEFTSSTCSPCATLNGSYFNTTFLNNNTGHYSLIKYQMNWPSPGDTYYTAEGGERRSYYGVNSVPNLRLDGPDHTAFDTTVLQADLDAAYAAPAYFVMNAVHTIDSANEMVYVNVDVTPYLTGDFTLQCAVVEKTTTGNVGSNGETEFHNVMMKMVPDASGTPAAFVADTPKSFSIQASLNGTNIEDWTDLEVVVFLQDDSNKVVMQSAVSVEDATNGVEDVVFNTLSIYPTPATNYIHVANAEGMQITIYNLNGSVLFQKDNLLAQNTLTLPQLANGVYLAKFTKDGKSAVRKLIISK